MWPETRSIPCMTRLALLYRTARNLSTAQAAAWVRARLRPNARIAAVHGDPPVAAGHWESIRRAILALGPGDIEGRLLRADRVVDGRFRYLNHEVQLPRVQWSSGYHSQLWTFQLRYFDSSTDLAWAWQETGNPRYMEAFLTLWSGWLAEIESGAARIDPYPTSVRIANTLRSLLIMDEQLAAPVRRRLLSATHSELAWLEKRLEVHLQGNHLLKNLTALAWGSMVFAGEDGERWRFHLTALWTELAHQVLPDGGHYERSPMYHAGVLADALEIAALCRAVGVPVEESVSGSLAEMARVLKLLTRRDGSSHLFGDTAHGERPSPSEVLGIAELVLGWRAPESDGPFALPDTGYFGWVHPSGLDRLIVTAASPGPPCQPGHSHCDMLSFELDWAGYPVVVDSGVHGYHGDPYREYVRSTRAHNTVSIGSQEQHEIWSTFRMARRGTVVEAASAMEGGLFQFRGACRPYQHRRAIHHRQILFGADSLTVTDGVQGADGTPVTSWLHLHPDVSIERSGDGWLGSAGNLLFRIHFFGIDEIRILRGEVDPIQGWHCPEFGIALAAPVFEMFIDRSDERAFGYILERM